MHLMRASLMCPMCLSHVPHALLAHTSHVPHTSHAPNASHTPHVPHGHRRHSVTQAAPCLSSTAVQPHLLTQSHIFYVKHDIDGSEAKTTVLQFILSDKQILADEAEILFSSLHVHTPVC